MNDKTTVRVKIKRAMTNILRELVSAWTGLAHGLVSMGLAWGLLYASGASILGPLGLFFIVAAVVNAVVNWVFYRRDTSRIGSWTGFRRGHDLWGILSGGKPNSICDKFEEGSSICIWPRRN